MRHLLKSLVGFAPARVQEGQDDVGQQAAGIKHLDTDESAFGIYVDVHHADDRDGIDGDRLPVTSAQRWLVSQVDIGGLLHG